MKPSLILTQYNLIIIRYSEIWLKSQKVKIRMLKTLMNNIKNMLQKKGVAFNKYQLSKDSSRIFFFFKNKDIQNAINVLNRVAGIHSFSPAFRTSSNLKNISERSLEVAGEVLNRGDTFAARVKRSGKHDFTSIDVAKLVGHEILEKYPEYHLKVDLSNPKKIIFIEVRDDFSYFFSEVIKSEWGGLPVEPRKKLLVMDVGRLHDLLAGLLLLRRGAVIYPLLFDMNENVDFFNKWMNNWKEVAPFSPSKAFSVKKIRLLPIIRKAMQSGLEDKYVCGICRLVRFDISSRLANTQTGSSFDKIKAFVDGTSLKQSTPCPDNVDLESISLNHLFSEYPIFTPIIGLESNEIEIFISTISDRLRDFDYCSLKPKNQEFNKKQIEKTYKSIGLDDIIEQSLKEIEHIKLT